MTSILEQLYNGNLYPYLKFHTIIEGFKVNREKAYHSYSEFLNKLPEEFKEEFVSLIDNHLDLLPYELEQNFIDGFSMGVRMMFEVFANPTNSDTPT